MKKRVSVQVDGVMVLTVLAVGGGLFLYSKRHLIGEALNKVNPAHQDNFVNQTAEKYAIRGEHNGHSYDTHLFAAVDLINPWNENDDYAQKVWGLQ
ncbi:hypothetical protein [Marinimicrobium sp. C2-29]|uniref:hypothetical protein n=1 Tax=Marinimicrobium sp. C2-29 TaxID=3139825 RepID=UPI003138D289